MFLSVEVSRDIIVRWSEPETGHIPLLKQGGITCAVLPARNEAFERAGIKTIASTDLHLASWQEIAATPSGKIAVLSDGQWPGITRRGTPQDADELASASREPWIDANSFWCGCLRAAFPKRPALLGYLPDERAGVTRDRIIRFDSLELALIDAWSGGGNYLLALWPEYRTALLAGNQQAVAAWQSLRRTGAWLRDNAALFQQPALPAITQLVEPGTESAELANLMYRRGATPALVSAATPPPPSPGRILALVAAGITAPEPAMAGRILAHAEAGATVVTDAPGESAWWRRPGLKPLKSQEDRDFFALGSGQVVAYKAAVADPSEFALDVIDMVAYGRRPMRIWNASSSIALASECPRGVGAALLRVVSYGGGRGRPAPALARIQGNFTKATVAGPGRAPAPLKTARRGTMTEVEISGSGKLDVIIFS